MGEQIEDYKQLAAQFPRVRLLEERTLYVHIIEGSTAERSMAQEILSLRTERDRLERERDRMREALDAVQGPLVAIRNNALVSHYGPDIEYVQKEVATAFNIIDAALKSEAL
jgi:hypothetical protein